MFERYDVGPPFPSNDIVCDQTRIDQPGTDCYSMIQVITQCVVES